MRDLLILIFLLLVISMLPRCANPKSPTGGPKDTIAPVLIYAQPLDQAIQVQTQEIILIFDEFINVDKLRSNLIITPVGDYKYKSFARKNQLTINFEEPFPDSTTLTLNFASGVTDITEKNPAINLSLAFSTGNYIDSLSVQGRVVNLLTGKSQKEYTVGLYAFTDTLDLRDTKPTYFATTTETGQFRIKNIKPNRYKVITFKDENKNLLFDAAKEAHGLIAQPIRLDTSFQDSLIIQSVEVNSLPLTRISDRPTSHYYDIKYNKPLTKFQFQQDSASLNNTLYAQLAGDLDNIRFYNTQQNYTDSTLIILKAADSVLNVLTDTLYVKFSESSRKPESFTLKPKTTNLVITESTTIGLIGNKPFFPNGPLEVIIYIDTIPAITYTNPPITYNPYNNKASISLPRFNQAIYLHTLDSLNQTLLQSDTAVSDSMALPVKTYSPKFYLELPKSQFLSAERDSSSAISVPASFGKPESYGTLKISFPSSYDSFYIQLLNKERVIATKQNCSSCVIEYLPPGDYTFRAFIDSNNNGRWDVGNILLDIEPEPILNFSKEITLRANWEIEVNLTMPQD